LGADQKVLHECNSEACKKCVQHISATIECDLMLHIRKSSAVRIVIDGFTDIPEEDRLFVFVLPEG
jgi:hypothetical protein